MTSTLTIPVKIIADVHEIEGGGYWAEVPCLPGCVAQAKTRERLEENIAQAIEDWMSDSTVKTEDEARKLAKIQGLSKPIDEAFPISYSYSPPDGHSC
jgi:predicted RNase H-like HicB family nuclease